MTTTVTTTVTTTATVTTTVTTTATVTTTVTTTTTVVSRLGLVVRHSAGKRKDVGFDSPLRLTFLLKKCYLWTLSRDFALHNE